MSSTTGGIPDPSAFWRAELERILRAGAEVTDPTAMARHLAESFQKQADFQATALREQREALSQLAQPLRSQADFLNDAAKPMRQLADLYRQASVLLEQQAALFEQAAAPIRGQTQRFDTLMGLGASDRTAGDA